MANATNNPQPSTQGTSPTGAQGTPGATSQRREEGTRSLEPYRGASELGRQGSSPFSFMRRFMGDMDRLFEEFGLGSSVSQWPARFEQTLPRGAWSPQIDVFERDGQLMVHADLPGLREEDLKVNVDQGVLTISGRREHAHEHDKGGVYRCERSYGAFQRSIALPQGVDAESIRASFDNGVLEVTVPLPKEEQGRGRTIPIGPKSGGSGIKH